MIKIAKGQIGQALTSNADNHIVAVSDDIYDEHYNGENDGEYQSVINRIHGVRLATVESNITSLENRMVWKTN